jgi:hypothetical protein
MVRGGQRHHGDHAQGLRKAHRNDHSQRPDHVHRNEETQKTGHTHGVRKGAEDLASVSEEVASTSDTGDAKGVVRLLEAGHFKGVAAVRLSINFHAELSARRSSTAAAEIESAAANLMEGVSEVLASSSEVPGDGDESTTANGSETFSNAVAEVVSGFRGGELDASAALAAFQMTFENLANSLNATPVEADESEAEEEGTAEVMPGAMEAVDPDSESVVVAEEVVAAAPSESDPISTLVASQGSMLDELDQLFGEFMDEVRSALDTMNSVREFAQPSGNGVAFEKFLSMYREMTAPVDAVSGADSAAMGDASETGGVDQLV